MNTLPNTSLKTWLRLLSTWPVARRALKFAVVVGIVLIAINHGDTIVARRLTRVDIVKMGLTMLVPYIVSALSSVGAMLEPGRMVPTADGVPDGSDSPRPDEMAGRGATPSSP